MRLPWPAHPQDWFPDRQTKPGVCNSNRLATSSFCGVFSLSRNHGLAVLGTRGTPPPEVIRQFEPPGQGRQTASSHFQSTVLCPLRESRLSRFDRNSTQSKHLAPRQLPLTSSIAFFGNPNVSARNAISAALARPSNGGACTAIFSWAESPSP